jgi:aminoglycoside phosphotransferase (APT) family kinase protein
VQRNHPKLIEPLPEVAIQAIVNNTFGDNARILLCEELTGGLFNTSYHLVTSDPDLDMVLRIAPSDKSRLLSYEQTMMMAEPVIYAMLRDAGIPVPRVFAYDSSGKIVPRDFIFVEYIEAECMDSPKIPSEAKPLLLRQLGSYLAMIHGIQGYQFGWPTEDGDIRGHQTWSEVFSFMLNEIIICCATHGIISKADVSKIETTFGTHRSLFEMVGEPRLTHNDIWAPNILACEEGGWHIAAIIDADRAMFADREFESALWWTPEPQFWDGYGKTLDPSPEARFRRKIYELYFNLWQAFAFKVQIWNPAWHESFRQRALNILKELTS